MLLWLAFALLTAAVLAWMLAPLARPQPAGEATAAEAGARAVYRDQLAEVERERAAGLIGPAEADAARIEISRRLLASAAHDEVAASGATAQQPTVRHQRAALAIAVAIPLLTLALYLWHGAPGMPSGSLHALTEAQREMRTVALLIAKVESRLQENPDDGKGWEVIAPVYLKLGRFADAAAAFGNAVRLRGETVPLLAGLAEASMLAQEGKVTPEARAAYTKILKLEPGRPEPRFWLALGKEQDGRLADARADYAALLKEAPADATYRPVLEKRIAEVGARIAAEDKAPGPSGGPTAADLESAAKLTPEARTAMINGMVEGLAARLKRDGKDLPGWKRLIQSYKALDRGGDARAALAEARRQFEGDAAALADLSQLADTLGLGS